MNKEELKSFAITAQNEIDNGSAEDRLRHLLSASLRRILRYQEFLRKVIIK